MMSANAEYLVGSCLLMAACASPVVVCAAGWVGERLRANNSPKRWFRVAIYWSGACGATMDVFCLYIPATFHPDHRTVWGGLDRVSHSVILNGVPVVFLFVIGAYTVLIGIALAAIAANAAAIRLGKVLLHATPHRNRCPLHYRCSGPRRPR